MDDVNKLTTDDPIKLAIANKSDLDDKKQVFDNDMKNFTGQTGIEVITASAKNSIGITDAFEKMTKLLTDKR